ncbi:uncharacterized protein LOC117646280 [Thrips palmi]|uniref:Uncharacterized protein LOC117646280 n=1 Tax=Thrips palmi TaxID=161013 RepID=A0A6P8YSI2_THRPL|nr:uncharacterized protein LOC117646280 [Thrips palmi]
MATKRVMLAEGCRPRPPSPWPARPAMAFLRTACFAILPLLVSPNLTFYEELCPLPANDGPASSKLAPPVGRCDFDANSLVVMEDFDMEEYAGSWHEVYASGNPRNCSTHVFATASGAVTYFEKDYDLSTATYRAIQGRVQSVATAQVLIRRPRVVGLETYSILDTDYLTYAIVHTCTVLASEPAAVRVLSRDYVLPSRVAEAVDAVLLRSFSLTRDELTATDNKGCIPDTCPPVGPTAQYLDLRQFAGWWHQLMILSKDPPQTAMPSCTKWLLTPAPNDSVFLQREVPSKDQNQSPRRLPTLEARPDDPLAGDGHFSIQQRLEGASSTVRFDVLGVDYQSWALVAVCNHTLMRSNLNRAVEMYTILLSRYPLVDSVPWSELRDTLARHDLQGLHREVTSSMSCPSPRCLDWIPAKAPFDAERFLGYWFVMEQTATKSDTGFCAKHLLSWDNNVGSHDVHLDIIQYKRSPGALNVIPYRLSQDIPFEGKFTVVEPMPFGQLSSDSFKTYWVLDTDYESFAVVYSCSGPREERVWIMSRVPGLSWTASRHVVDVLVQSHVDVAALRTVDWPVFCATWPDPSVDPDDPDRPQKPLKSQLKRHMDTREET